LDSAAVISGIIASIPDIIKAIPEIITAIINGFISYFTKMWEIGENLIKGIGEGFASGATGIIEKIKEAGSKVVSGLKDFFGIHSPSTVFAGIGGNLADGIGVGFGAEMEKVTAKMKAAMPTEFDTSAKIDVQADGTAAWINAQNGDGTGRTTERPPQIVVTQNIYTPQYNYAEQQQAAARELRRLARRATV
jgi:hypothetical protein